MLQGSFFSLYQDYHKKCITVYHLSIFYIPPHFLARFGGSPSKIFIPRNILGLRNPQSLGARHSTFARGHAPGCGRACARVWAGVCPGVGGCVPGHGRVCARVWAGMCPGMGGCAPGHRRVCAWAWAGVCLGVGGYIPGVIREGMPVHAGAAWYIARCVAMWAGESSAGSGRASAATGGGAKRKPEAAPGGPLLWLFCDCRRGQTFYLTAIEPG